MTKSEVKAMKAYTKDLIKEGVDKQIAKVMAKAMVESRAVVPVVEVVDHSAERR